MLFPLHDENPVDKRPIVTYTLIGLNVIVWLAVQGAGTDPLLAISICKWGLTSGDLLSNIPAGTQIRLSEMHFCRFDASPDPLTLLTSMFMHGGWLHIIGNMWFLWIFGDNIENAMGRTRFAIFYVLCGLLAAFAQIATNLSSVVPMVGASGAVSGVMGAYIVLHPRARVRSFLFLGIFFMFIKVPAVVILGVWITIQLLSGLAVLGAADTGGIAFWAHLGGFAAGAALILLFKRREEKFTIQY